MGNRSVDSPVIWVNDRTGPNGPGYYAGIPGDLRKLTLLTP